MKTFQQYPGLYGPRHEKTCLFNMRTTKAQISLRMRLCVRCLSMIPLVSISELSSLHLSLEVGQAGLNLPWSQTPKTGFRVTRLILSKDRLYFSQVLAQGEDLLIVKVL